MTTSKVFVKICIYYRIWIESYAVIIESIYLLLRKNEPFVWNNKQKEIMYFLKMLLTRVFALRAIDYFENVDNIILSVNVSNAEWKAMLMQKHKHKKHSNKYENELWTNVEKNVNSKKRKCRKLLKAFKKNRFWLCEIHFIVKINVNSFVIQLNQSIVDLSKAFVIW